MLKKIFGMFVMLVMLASFAAANPVVKATPESPTTEDHITCYVDGTNAMYDMYWYNDGNLLVSQGNTNKLVLPNTMTEEGKTYTCKVFRPSSHYLPEVHIGSIKVQVDSGEIFFWDNNFNFMPMIFPQCMDNMDNDGDGKVDMDDPGCSNPEDNDEFNFNYIPEFPKFIFPLLDLDEEEPYVPQCSDGVDNDGDGKVDMDDPGCSNPEDDDESNSLPYTLPQCMDNVDNDGDGKVDMDDPGCTNPLDNDEIDDPVDDEPEDNAERNHSAAEIKLENAILSVKDDELEIMAMLYNNGGSTARGIDITIYIEDLGILNYVGVGSIRPNSPTEVMHYIDLEGVSAGRYNVRIEALGKDGVIDIIYRSFDIEEKPYGVEVVYNIEEPVDEVIELTWWQKIVKKVVAFFSFLF